jgi:restriction system protein
MNEGAAKGILVSTSGYGKASYEFGNNKPLQLISGGELLYLLDQHTGVKARIEFPDDWDDPAGLTEPGPPARPSVVEPEAVTAG